jgi:acyl-coenzyme A synthetase/AMP-(fatty) acid ligase
MTTLEELSQQALAREARPAVEFKGQWFNWDDLRRVAERLGTLLDSCGIEAHTPIAFVIRNRPSALAALLGLIAQGRTIRMIYAFQSAAALARDVRGLRPAVLIAASEDYSPELLSTLRDVGAAAIALEEMHARFVPGCERARHSESAHPLQPRIEILTSGTTGPPKAFALSYEVIARHIVGIHPRSATQDREILNAPPTLLFFPLGNISGLYSTLPPLLKGQRAVLLERFSVAGWHDHLLRFRPEVSGLPPAGVQMVMDADIPRADLACIRRFGTGAAPLDPTVHKAFEERYAIPILLSYGATEFGGPVTAMTPELHAIWGKKKFGSVGRPLPDAQLRVIQAETGEVLPLGQEGILEVISPRIGPNWIRTSDIAMIDEHGFLFLRGRADGAIMRGGFKVLPETIERALLLHPAISAAAVAGITDPRLGQVPAAAIQLKPAAQQPTIAELETHLRAHVYATHIPVRWCFIRALPRTPSLKVDRPALRELLEANQTS